MMDIYEIPKMTHELSSAWDQPSRSEILLDGDHKIAYMTQHTMNQLPTYSCSQPTGVYEGKMWKGQGRDGTWFLLWFGPSEFEGHCGTYRRTIKIVDELLIEPFCSCMTYGNAGGPPTGNDIDPKCMIHGD